MPPALTPVRTFRSLGLPASRTSASLWLTVVPPALIFVFTFMGSPPHQETFTSRGRVRWERPPRGTPALLRGPRNPPSTLVTRQRERKPSSLRGRISPSLVQELDQDPHASRTSASLWFVVRPPALTPVRTFRSLGLPASRTSASLWLSFVSPALIFVFPFMASRRSSDLFTSRGRVRWERPPRGTPALLRGPRNPPS